MGLGAASSRVCFDTISDIEFPCLSLPAHFSAVAELHLSTDGVKKTESPQKCKVKGKKRLWVFWWFGLSVFPLQLVVSQCFRFQALCHRAVLRYRASYQNQICDHALVFFLFLPLQNHGKSKDKEGPQGSPSTR